MKIKILPSLRFWSNSTDKINKFNIFEKYNGNLNKTNNTDGEDIGITVFMHIWQKAIFNNMVMEEFTINMANKIQEVVSYNLTNTEC